MGKKKRGYPDVEDVLARPWCYYCERDFDDLKILISHQKAKHFKCERCGRRLNTAGGLSVHMSQVHKEQLSTVENALPNRQGLEVEIFGMEGIPDDVMQAHNTRVLQQFYEAQAERRAKSGNVAPGEQPQKKLKIEAEEDLRQRLADWRIKKQNGEDPTVQPAQELASPAVPATHSPMPANGPPGVSPAQSAFPTPIYQTGANSFPQYPPGVQQPGSYAAAPPGLPQRPVFSPPGFNSQQMGQPPNLNGGVDDAALDDLIASATRPAAKAEDPRKSKKEKDKNSKMIYSDNDISPEEKMAGLARYAITG